MGDSDKKEKTVSSLMKFVSVMTTKTCGNTERMYYLKETLGKGKGKGKAGRTTSSVIGHRLEPNSESVCAASSASACL